MASSTHCGAAGRTPKWVLCCHPTSKFCIDVPDWQFEAYKYGCKCVRPQTTQNVQKHAEGYATINLLAFKGVRGLFTVFVFCCKRQIWLFPWDLEVRKILSCFKNCSNGKQLHSKWQLSWKPINRAHYKIQSRNINAKTLYPNFPFWMLICVFESWSKSHSHIYKTAPLILDTGKEIHSWPT